MGITEKKKKIDYDMQVSQLQKQIYSNKETIKKLSSKITQYKTTQGYYTVIAIISIYFQTIDHYFEMNTIHQNFYNKSQPTILDKIRKELSTILTLLEQSFGTNLPDDLTTNSELMNSLTLLTPKRLCNFIRKLENECSTLKDAYGINSKYYITSVNLYSKFCNFSVNTTNFKEYFNKLRNLQDADYKDMREHIIFIQQFLDKSSELNIKAYHVSLSKTMVEDALKKLEFLELINKFSPIKDGIRKTTEDIKRCHDSWARLLTN
ncbi:MAG: hypothetical protein ACRCTQ_03025 [Brevinemataceae bacterium]